MTSEEELLNRMAYAISNGWDSVPRCKIVDEECPYCGAELAFYYDYEGMDETEEECPACGKVFDLSIEFVPMYECRRRDVE